MTQPHTGNSVGRPGVVRGVYVVLCYWRRREAREKKSACVVLCRLMFDYVVWCRMVSCACVCECECVYLCAHSAEPVYLEG
jgi:hypothetical protein